MYEYIIVFIGSTTTTTTTTTDMVAEVEERGSPEQQQQETQQHRTFELALQRFKQQEDEEDNEAADNNNTLLPTVSGGDVHKFAVCRLRDAHIDEYFYYVAKSGQALFDWSCIHDAFMCKLQVCWLYTQHMHYRIFTINSPTNNSPWAVISKRSNRY